MHSYLATRRSHNSLIDRLRIPKCPTPPGHGYLRAQLYLTGGELSSIGVLSTGLTCSVNRLDPLPGAVPVGRGSCPLQCVRAPTW